MKLARHIMVARQDGPEAGMDTLLATPIAQKHPQVIEIKRKRTRASKIKTYCALYADQLAVPDEHIGRKVGRPRKNTAPAVNQTPNINDLFAQFAEFVASQGISTEVESVPESVIETASASRKTTHVGGKRVNMPASCITAGTAWEILNVDGDFPQPRDTGKPATDGQLYRLNVLGLLPEALAATLG